MSSKEIEQEVKRIIGINRAKERFEQGERISLEQLMGKYGVCKGQCHTCAFRPDSPETQAFYESYPSQLSTILECIDEAVEGKGPYRLFFCHRNMPSEDGGKNFQPDFDGDGVPVGHKICAGWLRSVNRAGRRKNE